LLLNLAEKMSTNNTVTNMFKKDLIQKLENFIQKRFNPINNIKLLSEAYSDYLLLDPNDRPPMNSMLRLLETSFFDYEVDTLAVNLTSDGPEFLMSISGKASKAGHLIFGEFYLSYDLIEIKSIGVAKDGRLKFEEISECDATLISNYMQSRVEWDYVSPRKLPEYLKN